jgi:hypothetical protein
MRLTLLARTKFMSLQEIEHQTFYCHSIGEVAEKTGFPLEQKVINYVTDNLKDFSSFISRSRVAQAVWCLTTGWTTGRSGFDPRQGQKFFL